MARILFTTFGSFGDLYPYLALGVALRNRGHQAAIATSAVYRARVEAEGLAFHPVRPDVSLDDRVLLEYVFDARRGSERVLRFMASAVRESYEDTLQAAGHADVVVTHPITYAAVLAAQKLRKPWISSVLAPISFLSACDPPVPAAAPWLVRLRILGPGFMKVLWDLARRQVLGWLDPLLDFRNEIGLGPAPHPAFEGAHSPSLVLALFSRYLAEPQPDWPRQTVVTGFPFYDREHDRGEVAPELVRFLDDGPAPAVFTLGSSAVGAAGKFYLHSLDAVERLGLRAIFLTGRHPQGLPEVLPPGTIAVPYAPHAAVFPRAAAIVHQGGIGTTGQAMRSGRPMLVVPFSHDQFDNGARVRRLGAGEVVYRTRYDARSAARSLRSLVENAAYARAAAALGEKVRSEDGCAATADAVEAMIGRR